MPDEPSPLSHTAMLDLWESRKEFVAKLNKLTPAELGPIIYSSVQSWHQRSRIPAKHWPAMEALAKACGIRGVTQATLAKADAAMPRKRPGPRPRQRETSSPTP